MEAIFFESAAVLRAWLEANHDREPELWVGFWRTSTGRATLRWAEVVDEALCFGWIDGIRKSIDAERYMNRLTPRRSRSTWSAVNIRRVGELTAAGLMRPSGLAAFETRDPRRQGLYAHEGEAASRELDPAAQAALEADPAAAAFFRAQPPSYQRVASWWVISAKQPATRARRLETLIADSAAGRRVGVTDWRRRSGPATEAAEEPAR